MASHVISKNSLSTPSSHAFWLVLFSFGSRILAFDYSHSTLCIAPHAPFGSVNTNFFLNHFQDSRSHRDIKTLTTITVDNWTDTCRLLFHLLKIETNYYFFNTVFHHHRLKSRHWYSLWQDHFCEPRWSSLRHHKVAPSALMLTCTATRRNPRRRWQLRQ